MKQYFSAKRICELEWSFSITTSYVDNTITDMYMTVSYLLKLIIVLLLMRLRIDSPIHIDPFDSCDVFVLHDSRIISEKHFDQKEGALAFSN